jgi:hypothetical protein
MVMQRLDVHGWAFVSDVASAGKTTLAYRIAARPEYRDSPAYHLLLSRLQLDDADNDSGPQAALVRLARPGTLLVIDDAHQAPELAVALWQQWRERPMGSRLILLATKIDRQVNLAGDNALRRFEEDASNPPIIVHTSPADLGAIARYVLTRLGSAVTGFAPPDENLNDWHAVFGREIGAFVVAVSQQRNTLAGQDYTLPEEAAAAWMRERHIERPRLEYADIENAVCLAVFADQDLELSVPEECLPAPSRIGRLLKSGLAERTLIAEGRFVRYTLRVPTWRRLLLALVEDPPDETEVFAKASALNIVLTTLLFSRFRLYRSSNYISRAWARTSDLMISNICKLAWSTPLTYIVNFSKLCQLSEDDLLYRVLWNTLAADPERLADRAFETPLGDLASFLKEAVAQKQDALVAALWSALAADPERLADRAFDTPLHFLATFLKEAVAQKQDALVAALWSALAADPERLARHARAELPSTFMSFLVFAPDHLKRSVFEKLRFEDWNAGLYRLARFSTGAPGLAAQFGAHGREDLQAGLIDAVLSRKNPLDFFDPKSALLEMSRLLALVSPAQLEALPDFLAAVCSRARLRVWYDAASTKALAGALHIIAVHQPPAVSGRFFQDQTLRQQLTERFQKEIGAAANPDLLTGAIQLLGSLQLGGILIRRMFVADLAPERVTAVPQALPHRPETVIVERFQRQLWLGLRALASLKNRPLPVSPGVLRETRDLWQRNIDGAGEHPGSLTDPTSTAHRINLSMVGWLDICLRFGGNHLLPVSEPLWVLAGFPHDPRLTPG